jgi:glycosyltransferase involved in cell wall biosynthesis
MKKVLYLAAGNPFKPRVGMDLVIHEHIKELAQDPNIALTVVAVAPGIDGQPAPGHYPVGAAQVDMFVGDLLTESGGLHRLRNKLKMVLSRSVPVMAYSFSSAPAASCIRALVGKQKFDAIVIDHFYALTNIDLNQVRRSGARLIYVSHDAMYPHIAEMASMKEGLAAKAYYMLEAWRTGRVERRLFDMATKVVHLSEFERMQVTSDLHKHVAMLPPICSPDALAAAQVGADPAYANSVVFIGSPNHPPNAHALQWIIDEFAPVLAQVAPHLQIALIGGGTDQLAAGVPNVKGYGFVSSDLLQRMLASCVCSISPVVRGRGIKVKVLDAIAAGCPLFAAEESLRGFEGFDLQAGIRLDQPAQLANAIVDLASTDGKQKAARQAMSDRWSEFLSVRKGQLAAVVTG